MKAAALLLLAASPPTGAWMQCLADQAQRFAATAEPSEVAADAAMGACAEAEGRVVEAEVNGLGAEARERVRRAQSDGRALIRQRVIARIVEIRAAR